jgi:hypothetical protein
MADPIGYPVRLLITVAVQFTVLALPRPELSHWVIDVTGAVEVIVPLSGQLAAAGHERVVTIVAKPGCWLGVAAL